MPSPNKPGYDKILADCGPSKHNNCESHLPNIHVFVYTVQPAGEEYLYESTPATFYDVKQQRQLPYLKNNSQSTINIHICFFTVKCFYWRKGNDAAELREFLFRPASHGSAWFTLLLAFYFYKYLYRWDRNFFLLLL